MVNFTQPQTSAAISGWAETKVSAMVVKSWTDCRTPNSLEETHRLLRCAFMLSTSAVNARIDVASGLLLCASSRAFCVGSKWAWNWRTAVARASIP